MPDALLDLPEEENNATVSMEISDSPLNSPDKENSPTKSMDSTDPNVLEDISNMAIKDARNVHKEYQAFIERMCKDLMPEKKEMWEKAYNAFKKDQGKCLFFHVD